LALIVEQLREDPQLTIPDLASRLSKSASAVQRGILKLQQQGYLRRTGSRKSGHWEVIDHD
jgi:DeoR/GlpR family transcriptional regulator of sugar metabolism